MRKIRTNITNKELNARLLNLEKTLGDHIKKVYPLAHSIDQLNIYNPKGKDIEELIVGGMSELYKSPTTLGDNLGKDHEKDPEQKTWKNAMEKSKNKIVNVEETMKRLAEESGAKE